MYLRKSVMVLATLLLVLVGCSKEEEKCGPAPLEQEGRREAIIRIALEGAAMLEEEGSTRSAAGRRVSAEGITCRTVPSTRSDGGSDTLYYVVNFEDNAGFALVAADEERPERLLAVTEQGSYEAGATSDNEGFNLYMTLLDRSLILDPDKPREPIDTVEHEHGQYQKEDYYSDWTSKGPYVKVKWGQGAGSTYNWAYPYNKYCITNNGAYCPAGCSVVAVAQIMSYHKKPGSYKLTFDGSNTTRPIDWESLTACVGGSWFDWPYETADEIALLMREIGKRADIKYHLGDYGASLQQSRHAFAAFGYDQYPGRRYTFEDTRRELDAGRPLYMRGDGTNPDTNETVYHAWVVDGYKCRTHYIKEYVDYDYGREYFRDDAISCQYVHINWGYDGANDGYFKSGVFDLAHAYEYDSDFNYIKTVYDYDLQIMTGIWNNK